MISKKCKLEECDIILHGDSNPRMEYCCPGHGSLNRLRNKRNKDKNNKTNEKPYISIGTICPIDGTVFPSQMYKKRGRPKKYDCDSCREISKQLNLLSK